MTRYYFDIKHGDGGVAPDEEGLELPGREAAEVEAARSLADLMTDASQDATEQRYFTIGVRSNDGTRFKAMLVFERESILH